MAMKMEPVMKKATVTLLQAPASARCKRERKAQRRRCRSPGL
jgi:hypothetical protein